MAGQYPVTGEQYRTIDRRMREIKRQLDQENGSPIDPELVVKRLQLLIEGRECEYSLIRGMFAEPLTQLSYAKERNASRNWGFTDVDFERLGPPPAWPWGNLLQVVILDISLDTVEQTFEEAWEAVKGTNRRNWRLDALMSDPKSLRLLPDANTHVRGLRWQIVDLGANRSERPIDVRNPATSPSSAILWMAFYSPKWLQAMNGKAIPYVWIPGYEATILHSRAGMDVLNLCWHLNLHRVELSANDAEIGYADFAVPVIL